MITLSEKGYDEAVQQKDSSLMARAHLNTGIGHFIVGDKDEALRLYLESLQGYERLEDTAGMISAYNELCVLYVGQKKFLEANEVISKAIKYSELTHNSQQLANGHNNRGLMYLDQHKNDSARKDFERAYFHYKQVHEIVGMSYSLDYLSSVLADEGDLDKALKYLRESRRLRIQTGDKMGEAMSINNIGELLLMQKKPLEALSYFAIARDTARKINFKGLVANTYKMEGDAQRQLGNYEQAYAALEAYQKVNEEILNDKKINAIEEWQIKYESEKKERLNQQLQQANKLQAITLSRRNIALTSSGIGLLLAIGISYLLYNRRRLRQQARHQQELFVQQELRTQAIIDAEENERQRLARELHDGVGQILSAVRRKMQVLQRGDDALDGEAEESLSLLDESIREVRQLSHNMMPPALRNKNLTEALDELAARVRQTTDLEVVTEWVGAGQLQLEKSQSLMLYRAVQEMISNIIKHAQAKTLTIELVNHEKELTLMVYDDGKGFDREKMMEGGGGLGLKNIESRISFIGGRLELDTSPGNGATYIIDLPLNPEA